MFTTLTIVILMYLILELWLKPRLDKTPNNEMFLWYGIKKRKFIKLR